MASKPRGWTGARTPSSLKRVRQDARKAAINQPRRSAAKTLVAKAVRIATTTPEGASVPESLAEAMSALDRAAKAGAIHRNAADRRKSRLARKVAATVGGALVQTSRVAKSTGTAAAAKAAKARVAASKATKAKGPQTAAGKARAALTRTARTEAPAAPAATPEATPAPRTRSKATTGESAAKSTAKTTAKSTAAKSTAKSTAKTAAKSTAKTAAKSAATAPAKAAPKTTRAKTAKS